MYASHEGTQEDWKRRPLHIGIKMVSKQSHPQYRMIMCSNIFLLDGKTLPEAKAHYQCSTLGFPPNGTPKWTLDQYDGREQSYYTDIDPLGFPVHIMFATQDEVTSNHDSPPTIHPFWARRLVEDPPLVIRNTRLPRPPYSTHEVQFILNVALELDFKTPRQAERWLSDALEHQEDHFE